MLGVAWFSQVHLFPLGLGNRSESSRVFFTHGVFAFFGFIASAAVCAGESADYQQWRKTTSACGPALQAMVKADVPASIALTSCRHSASSADREISGLLNLRATPKDLKWHEHDCATGPGADDGDESWSFSSLSSLCRVASFSRERSFFPDPLVLLGCDAPRTTIPSRK